MKMYKIKSCELCPYSALDFEGFFYSCDLMNKKLKDEEQIDPDCPLDDCCDAGRIPEKPVRKLKAC